MTDVRILNTSLIHFKDIILATILLLMINNYVTPNQLIFIENTSHYMFKMKNEKQLYASC
jgi:hypothetical protein